jgi:hypothetical protein
MVEALVMLIGKPRERSIAGSKNFLALSSENFIIRPDQPILGL